MSCGLSKLEGEGHEVREWLWMYFQNSYGDRQHLFSRMVLAYGWRMDIMCLLNFPTRGVKPVQLSAMACGLTDPPLALLGPAACGGEPVFFRAAVS